MELLPSRQVAVGLSQAGSSGGTEKGQVLEMLEILLADVGCKE